MRLVFVVTSILVVCASPAAAARRCQSIDVAELCKLARDMRADNPEFGRGGQWTSAEESAREQRRAERRARARAPLHATPEPTWRDLVNAGYVIAHGETAGDHMFAHAIAIRAPSLAPNEPDTHLLVAMTIDAIGLKYLGAQVYGRQKFFKLKPGTAEVEFACLPQMIDPPLPASVGTAFDPWPEGYQRCPKDVGEIGAKGTK